MKLRNLLQTAVAVLMAVMLLASCGAAPTAGSASREERKTNSRSEETIDKETKKTEKEDTEEQNSPLDPAETTTAAVFDFLTTAEPAETTEATTTTTEMPKITFDQITYFPKTAVSFNDSDADIRYIIDSATGEIILPIDYSSGRYNGAYWTGFSKNLVLLDINDRDVYVDAKGIDVTELIVNGSYIFEDGKYKGIKDKSGKIIVDAMYDYLYETANSDYFVFSLNSKYGVVNSSGEMIIKGLDSGLRNATFYPENIVVGQSLYSLPDGKLIGEYSYLKVYDDKTFLVATDSRNDAPVARIIDSKGNVKTDLLAGAPLPAEAGVRVNLSNFDNEKTWYYVYLYKNRERYYALFNAAGQNLFGWTSNMNNLLYCNNAIIYYPYSDGTGVSVYAYNGSKLLSDGANIRYATGKVYIQPSGDYYKMTAYDGTVIGEFSDYSCRLDSIIVTDTDGMFKGLIYGDKLVYPCEYPDIDYIELDNVRVYVKLSKGSSTTIVSAATGKEVVFPDGTFN
jgi:hypothetical protein